MKKSILLLSGAGIAAAVAIALTNTKKRSGQFAPAETGERRNTEPANDNSGPASQDENSAPSSASKAEAPSPGDDNTSTEKVSGTSTHAVDAIEIDDHGTDQETASVILERVRDNAFDSSDEKLALALGRPAEEVTGWMDGSETIDGDVLLKIRALAMERGVELPEASASN